VVTRSCAAWKIGAELAVTYLNDKAKAYVERRPLHHELFRRREGRPELQSDGAGEGGPRGHCTLSGVRARNEADPGLSHLARALATRAASGIAHFDALLSEAVSRAPAGRLVTIEDVGIACAAPATDGARLITGDTLYIDGGYHIMG
jgi:hypothetical protein